MTPKSLLADLIYNGGTRSQTSTNTVLVAVTKDLRVVVGAPREAVACRWVTEQVATKLVGKV